MESNIQDDNTWILWNGGRPLSKECVAFQDQRNKALVSVDSMGGTAEADRGRRSNITVGREEYIL